MTSASARPRYIHCLVVALLLGGCRSSPPAASVPVVDLLREMDGAEQRPPGAFRLTEYRREGVSRPAIAAAVPSRLTVRLPLPRRGVFHAFVGLADAPAGHDPVGARLRVGVSDDRTYDALGELVLVPGAHGWIEVRTDLSAYAGWKWSVFYRPERTVWRVVLAADAVAAGPATVLWAEPAIETDTESAREYVARRQRMR
jgi:hypothetical protein